MPPRVTVAQAVDAVRQLPADRTGFVGIDGLGGAGKSCLAAAILAKVPRTVVVPTDDFQGEGVPEWDWPRLRREVIAPLLAGQAAEYDVRRWGESVVRGRTFVPVGALVVVEGVSATRPELDVPWDLTLWVDTPAEVRRARIAERDGPGTASLWSEHWWPTETAYVERERPQERVDLIVSGG